MASSLRRWSGPLAASLAGLPGAALGREPGALLSIGPVPIEFILFAIVLAGVALAHHHTMRIAFGGAIVITLYKIVFSPFKTGALALKQGGYDWGFLAYAVGFGGSVLWFGSSAGVALASMYPQARSAGLWLRNGWHVAVAYVVGFFVMLALIGFEPGSVLAGSATPPAIAPTSGR